MWVSDQPEKSRDEEQKKKREYFLDLQHQIELKKLREQDLRQQEQELERLFRVDDRSPSKWLVQGGQMDEPDATPRDWRTSNFWFPRQPVASSTSALASEPTSDGGGNQSMGRPSTSSALPSGSGTSQIPGSYSPFASSSSHLRFRVTDQHETNERLRERARKLEWRRVLDQQVAEQARKNRLKEDEQKKYDEELAKMERNFVEDLHLRAQRKIGLLPAPSVEHDTSHNYVALPSPPRPRMRSSRENSSNADSFPQQQQQQMQQSRGVTPPPAPVKSEAVELHPEILSEYHRLLTEIRNEAAQLRREKEEIRQERTLLQLANERTTHLLERNLKIQQLQLQEAAARSFDDGLVGHTNRNDNFQQRSPLGEHGSPLRSPVGPTKVASFHHAGTAGSISDPTVASSQYLRPEGVTLEDFATPSSYVPPTVRLSPRARPRQMRQRQRRENPLDQSLNGESVFIPLSKFAQEAAEELSSSNEPRRSNGNRRPEEEEEEMEMPSQTSSYSGGFMPLEPSSTPSMYPPRGRRHETMSSSAGSIRTPSPKRKPTNGAKGRASAPLKAKAQAKSIPKTKSIEDNRVIKSTGFYNYEQDSATPEPIFGSKRAKKRAPGTSLHDSMRRNGTADQASDNTSTRSHGERQHSASQISDRSTKSANSPARSSSNLFQVVSFV